MTGAEHGQASVELVAVLPVVLGVALGAGQLLAAGAAREAAAGAAEAGAVALLQDRDALRAAGDALPAWAREHGEIDVAGRRIRVRVRPRTVLPGLAGVTTADETADAGPAR